MVAVLGNGCGCNGGEAAAVDGGWAKLGSLQGVPTCVPRLRPPCRGTNWEPFPAIELKQCGVRGKRTATAFRKEGVHELPQKKEAYAEVAEAPFSGS